MAGPNGPRLSDAVERCTGIHACSCCRCRGLGYLTDCVLNVKGPPVVYLNKMLTLSKSFSTVRYPVLGYRVPGTGLFVTEYEAAAPPRSTPGQRPGTFGRGPPSQSEHRRQSISSPRSLRFAAWSSAAPLAGDPGRSASSLLRLRRRQPSVSGARSAPAPCSTRGPS